MLFSLLIAMEIPCLFIKSEPRGEACALLALLLSSRRGKQENASGDISALEDVEQVVTQRGRPCSGFRGRKWKGFITAPVPLTQVFPASSHEPL